MREEEGILTKEKKNIEERMKKDKGKTEEKNKTAAAVNTEEGKATDKRKRHMCNHEISIKDSFSALEKKVKANDESIAAIKEHIFVDSKDIHPLHFVDSSDDDDDGDVYKIFVRATLERLVCEASPSRPVKDPSHRILYKNNIKVSNLIDRVVPDTVKRGGKGGKGKENVASIENREKGKRGEGEEEEERGEKGNEKEKEKENEEDGKGEREENDGEGEGDKKYVRKTKM